MFTDELRCCRAWSRRRPTCTPGSAAWCPRSRRAPPAQPPARHRRSPHPRERSRSKDIGCVAVHNTPGLVGALLVGVSAAKALALGLGVPLVAVNHVASHIFACRLAAGRDIFPCVGLVVSGGHTALFRCDTALSLELLGGTRDDAAGEAFDKVAAILGLGVPRRAGGRARGRDRATRRRTTSRAPFLDDGRLEFSFSGLKTAVLYACHGQDVKKATPPGRAEAGRPRRRAFRPRWWTCWR